MFINIVAYINHFAFTIKPYKNKSIYKDQNRMCASLHDQFDFD